MRPNNGVVPPRSSCTVVGNVLLLLDWPQFKKRFNLGDFIFGKLCWRAFNFFKIFYASCAPAVTMQAQKVVPPDLQCKDKFLVQSAIVSDGLSAKDITSQMVVLGCILFSLIYGYSLVLNLWFGACFLVRERKG